MISILLPKATQGPKPFDNAHWPGVISSATADVGATKESRGGPPKSAAQTSPSIPPSADGVRVEEIARLAGVSCSGSGCEGTCFASIVRICFCVFMGNLVCAQAAGAFCVRSDLAAVAATDRPALVVGRLHNRTLGPDFVGGRNSVLMHRILNPQSPLIGGLPSAPASGSIS
jgi:hypothetical protein